MGDAKVREAREGATRELRTKVPAIRDTLHSLIGSTADTIKSAAGADHARAADAAHVLRRLQLTIKEAHALAAQADRVVSGEAD